MLPPGTYWQVTGNGETPAKALIAQLKAHDLPAHWVLTGTGGNALVRVMVGPFADDASLAEARSKLEAAGCRIIRTWR
jgi:cell division septation protein DedD